MKKNILFGLFVFALLTGMVLYQIPTFAQDNVAELKAQIAALQKRVEELESVPKADGEDADRFYFGSRARRWDPFAEMERMQEEMNRMFRHSFGRSGLNRGVFMNDMSFDYDFDVKEHKDRYEITFDMTGLDENKLDIEIKENSITVKGERSIEESEESGQSFISSKSFGSFLKMIPVPEDADTAKAKLEKRDSKVMIILPKKAT